MNLVWFFNNFVLTKIANTTPTIFPLLYWYQLLPLNGWYFRYSVDVRKLNLTLSIHPWVPADWLINPVFAKWTKILRAQNDLLGPGAYWLLRENTGFVHILDDYTVFHLKNVNIFPFWCIFINHSSFWMVLRIVIVWGLIYETIFIIKISNNLIVVCYWLMSIVISLNSHNEIFSFLYLNKEEEYTVQLYYFVFCLGNKE